MGDAAATQGAARAEIGAERLDASLRTLLRHLAAGVREARPAPDEWRAALDFLADTGRFSEPRRQEMVLLSDVLGLSALVEALNARRPTGATPNTPPDPFYLASAPARPDRADLRLKPGAPPLDVTVTVRGLNGMPVTGARVETWQANAAGLFDNQAPDSLPEHNLRGVFRADACGRVTYRAERPGAYRAPTDGPVGALLARLGRAALTPAHLSFRVTAPGFEPLVTRIFDAADPDLGADVVFAVRHGLTAPFQRHGEGWRTEIVLVLAPEPPR